MPRTLPSVVLIGRPNVGKSTLFNKMIGSRRAIVAPIAGTTRDSLAYPVTWRGASFQLSDTGGLYGASEDPLHHLVVQQGQRAIKGADLLVFLTDGQEGLASGDETIAREIRETGLPILFVVNKTDDKRAQKAVPEFYQLGFEPIYEISAEHGNGIGDLLDAIVERLGRKARTGDPGRAEKGDETAAPEVKAPAEPDETTIAIIGRPNVGKSSLLNRLLKEERVMVSDLPGTTRDAIDATLTWHRRQFRIVDTAGMRRPGRVRSGGKVELVSVAGSKKAIIDADVVALLIDSKEGATDQDAAIGGEADRAGRGVVIVANKWDLVKSQDQDFVKRFDDALRRKMRFLDYAPILHISALTGERAPKVLETLDRVAANRRKRVPTPALNRFIETIVAANPPVSPERRNVKIMYAAQIGVAPPTFVFFTNVATTFHFSYERFLVNKIREQFGFEGTPIRVQVRRRKKSVPGGRTRRPSASEDASKE
ncbi:MAG: ribosome biogenesis GTPase Der [Acidobacteria bacterium]|nr:ribosome biogenesis GTPase Der [Acidobacteriota bacterium]